MKRAKMTKQVRLLIFGGLLLNNGTIFLHSQYKTIPDFLCGLLVGFGLTMMIVGLIKQTRGGSACTSPNETAVTKTTD